MPDATYENIKPLISKAERDGSSMKCEFKCKKTGVTAEASAYLEHPQGLKATAVSSTKRNSWYAIKSFFYSLIGQQIGSNIAGHVAQDVASEAGNMGEKGTEWSGGEKNAAVLKAFNSVKDKFAWDEAEKTWVGKKE